MEGALSIFNEALEEYLEKHEKMSCSDSVGRVYNNIGCVYFQMGDLNSALTYMIQSLVAQRNALGLNSKAESALLNFALTQANTGYLKFKSEHMDALATLEESLLVSKSKFILRFILKLHLTLLILFICS